VLATGYRDGKGEKWIYCLDPNAPRMESIIHLRRGQLHWFLHGREYRGFFVGTGYQPKDPPTRTGVEGAFATDRRAFDPGFYLRIHDDLPAAFGNDHAAARTHWERHGIPEGRRPSTILDPAFYLANHGDLVDAFGADDLDSAITHWVANGVAEGRRSSPEFDVAWYLGNHGDLVAAFGANNFPAAVDHWNNHGLGEGRRSSAEFDVSHYLNSHGDLLAAFGPGNYQAAFDHWFRHGKAEGRKPIPWAWMAA